MESLIAEPSSEPTVDIRYPTILRRYFSTVIDFWFCFLLVGAVGLLPLSKEGVIYGRTIVLLGYFVLYEPLLTSKLATFGQLLLKVRVRALGDPNAKISIGRAYLRYAVKLILGIISFFTIPFTARQRAVHDFAAGSMMVRVSLAGRSPNRAR